jgi:hypothetical protein
VFSRKARRSPAKHGRKVRNPALATDVPAGAKFHTAWFADDGLHVFDLWDSPQQFQNFVETRLGPTTQRIGIKGQPHVQLSDAHAIFAPNV